MRTTAAAEAPEALGPPRYVLRGPEMGPLASGPGMTVAPVEGMTMPLLLKGASPRVRGRHLLTWEVTARVPHFHSCASPFRHGRCGEAAGPGAAGVGAVAAGQPECAVLGPYPRMCLGGQLPAPSTQWARRPQSARARTVASEFSMQAMRPRYQAGRICGTAAETALTRAGEAAGRTRRGASARSRHLKGAVIRIRERQPGPGQRRHRAGRGPFGVRGRRLPHRASAQEVSGAPARRW